MTLSQLQSYLKGRQQISFTLPDGHQVPAHYHITEVGRVDKHFIDCGGTERRESVISLQLWYSTDYDHRLHPEKLLNILELSQAKLGLPDLPLEVEYQGPETIGKFGLKISADGLHLAARKTTCLAMDACGIPVPEKMKSLALEIKQTADSCCSPGGGCC